MDQSIYSSPLHKHYHQQQQQLLHSHEQPPGPFVVMVPQEQPSPFSSPARPNYIINNPQSLRPNVAYQSSPQHTNNFRVGRFQDTPTHFKTTAGGYDDIMTSNNNQAVYSDFISMGIDGISDGVMNGDKNFNPRKEPNMSHKEKVPAWIESIPSFITEDNVSSFCYPGLLEENIEDIEHSNSPTPEELSEFQARKITLLSLQIYLCERNERIITPELQEKAMRILQESNANDSSMNFQEGVSISTNGESINKLSRIQSTPRKRKSRKH